MTFLLKYRNWALPKFAFAFICTTISYTTSYAQLENTLFLMHEVPQSNLLNPAVQIPCKVFVGFPALSSIHFNYSNSFFSYNDLLQPKGDSLNVNISHFQTKPDTRQQISAGLQISLINFGFIYNEYYFNFNIQDKVDAGIAYPTNLFGLALIGNTAKVGETYDLGGLKAFGLYYREWAFGVSKIIDNQLTVGVKAKVLFGKANISTTQSNLNLTTEDPMYYLSASGNARVKLSPINLKVNANGRDIEASFPPVSMATILNRKNPGFAIDLGAIYKFDNKITLSGSLLDVGYIRWTTLPAIVDGNASFQFKGFALNSLSNLYKVRDSLLNSYSLKSSISSYGTFLCPKLYLGATYSVYDWLNAGLISRSEVYHGKFISSLSLAGNAWYKHFLAGSISWSYFNGSIANLGAGIAARTPNFGFYVVSDNVYGAFKYKSARLLNIHFGFNLLFGCKDCNEKGKNIKAKGCAAYRDVEDKKARHKHWLKRTKK